MIVKVVKVGGCFSPDGFRVFPMDSSFSLTISLTNDPELTTAMGSDKEKYFQAEYNNDGDLIIGEEQIGLNW